MKKFLLLAVAIFLSSPAFAVTPKELADQAQATYQSGDYKNAIRNWNELIQMGFVNGDIYYNIGSAYWRIGQAGQARRYFLAAKEWSPRDSALRENLAFIESKVEPNKPSVDGPRALLKKIPFYRLSLNASESLWLCAVASLVFFGLLIVYRLKKQALYLVLSIVTLPLIFFGSFQYLARSGLPFAKSEAVVVAPNLALREQPLAEAPVLEELREGRLVRLNKVQGDFALVKSPSGKEGWAERSMLGEIP
jgi:tetratricopeptide (TPR) repeat protein